MFDLKANFKFRFEIFFNMTLSFFLNGKVERFKKNSKASFFSICWLISFCRRCCDIDLTWSQISKKFFLHQVPGLLLVALARMCLGAEAQKELKYVFQDSFSFSCQEIGAEMKCFSSHFIRKQFFQRHFEWNSLFFFFIVCATLLRHAVYKWRESASIRNSTSDFRGEVVKGSKAQRTEKKAKNFIRFTSESASNVKISFRREDNEWDFNSRNVECF